MRRYFLVLCLLLTATIVWSQPGTLQISVTVIPPFPSKAEGLLGSSGGNVLVTITNTARASQVFKLTPTLQGISQNFSISFNPNFNPASALSIGGNETRVFTYSQLVNHWGVAANPANWVYQGITPQAAQGPLPEGTYRFCMKAFDQAASGQELSQPGGSCGTFNLKGYDPPIILQPKKDEKIKAIDPQFLIFNWTPTGLPASTRYRFELVDMTENKLAFPEDAFKSQAVFPLLHRG
jgi:TANFOR domain-containing protein